MDNPQTTLAEKLKAANYVLVTVGRNPSVDQLAALIGLTLLLNKAGKHAAAVYSGETPSTIEFLKPEDTIEKTTDSLRDFIIALDKSKADKLRYKVEDDVVRIFITPYKTSITEHDLDFSQGDFNVDVVVALGVTEQDQLDEAIIAHGRILHDATVATVNLSAEGDFGSIHWQNPAASSLSEMMTELARLIGSDLVDNQIATALLTGIVAETDRFSNDKTTAAVMSASAVLMAAGANQQLVASQLALPETPATTDTGTMEHDELVDVDHADSPEEPEPEVETPPSDGSIAIDHNDDHESQKSDEHEPADEIFTLPEIEEESPEPETDAPDEQPPAGPSEDEGSEPRASVEHLSGGSKLITEPPMLGGQLSANTQAESLEPSGDPLSASNSSEDKILTRSSPLATIDQAQDEPAIPEEPPMIVTPDVPSPVAELETLTVPDLVAAPLPEPEAAPTPQAPVEQHMPIAGLTPPPPAWVTPQENPLDLPAEEPVVQTLSDLEAAAAEPPAQVDAARDEVMKALNAEPNTQPLPPVEALNAQPMVDSLNTPTESVVLPAMEPNAAFSESMQQIVPSLPLPPTAAPAIDPAATQFDPTSFGITSAPGAELPGTTGPQVIDPNAAPPVPPPIPFNFGAPPPPPTA